MMHKTVTSPPVTGPKAKDPQECITLAMIPEFELSEAAERRATARAVTEAAKAGMSEDDITLLFGLTISQARVYLEESYAAQMVHA